MDRCYIRLTYSKCLGIFDNLLMLDQAYYQYLILLIGFRKLVKYPVLSYKSLMNYSIEYIVYKVNK